MRYIKTILFYFYIILTLCFYPALLNASDILNSSYQREKFINSALDRYELKIQSLPSQSRKSLLNQSSSRQSTNNFKSSDFSDYSSVSESPKIKPLIKKNPLASLDLAFEGMRYHYKEPDFVKLFGTKQGVSASYSLRFHQNDPIEKLSDIFSFENNRKTVLIP